MRNSPEPILHLVHARPLPWSIIIQAFSHELHLPIVPYHEWLATLQRKAQTSDKGETDIEAMRANPALRLLEFFGHSDLRPGREAIGLARLEVKKAVEVSPTLEGVQQVGAENVKMWVQAWRSTGFLPTFTNGVAA